MIDLDDKQAVQTLDKSNLLGSVEQLPNQVRQTWEDVSKFEVPESYQQIRNVVVAGMGGSALGARIIQGLYFDQLKIPLTIVNGYDLPQFVNQETLVILSSYSGTTEETLSSFSHAKERGAKIVGIAVGGKLPELLNADGYPMFVFEPKYNPCNQPRMAIGYSVLAQLGVFQKAGLIDLAQEEVAGIIQTLEEANTKFGFGVSTAGNLAKQIAQKFFGKDIILVGSEFLTGNTHTFQNQLHENSKNFATYLIIPELNHHSMESLSHPLTNSENLIFLMINSDLYFSKVKTRFEVTKDVITRNKIEVLGFKPQASSKLLQSFETLAFGSYVCFYLAMLNELDPSPIPWVDYFKEKLSQV
ncbi:MAG: bifunctional phosphoglucose/phosphomannose isomerase [Patescibacteria group bacterium]|nr:bifunctional phosphoglucose/phosphomannose isomerase [Patescibacteria group bacterium]